jgi:hypothetical protein
LACYGLLPWIVEGRISNAISATDEIKWLSALGVSSLRNARQSGLNANNDKTKKGCGISPPQPSFCNTLKEARRRDHALALVSTARSERSA